MTMLSPTETVMRPAYAALGDWAPLGTATPGPRADALATEQLELMGDIALHVSRMDDPTLDGDALDALTDRIAALFARSEELRLAQMLTARAASDTWLASVDLD